MDRKKENDLLDPDYAATSSALRVKEQQDNKLTADRINGIVVEIFDEELNVRQKQLEEVEEKIFKAQKLLHIVRYVLVTSYYKKKNLETSPDDETLSVGFDKQSRIHPAVKKLLGSNSKLDVFCAGKGKRRLTSRNCDIESSVPPLAEIKKPKLEVKTEAPAPAAPAAIKISDQSIAKNRKKTRHRLIVGNISKWVPSSEDTTTHKWMMYVRGDKDSADVSHIIEKVIFYLHPSYRPHDVVEVKESPFHLSRRGWGEFPLRVQIFFKCSLNKPISIVHNLKLEKTFTGRQTLGSETVVDVYLYDNVPKPETITRPVEDTTNETDQQEILNYFDSPLSQDYEVDNQSFGDPLTTTYETKLAQTRVKSEPLELDLPSTNADCESADHTFDEYETQQNLEVEELCIKSEPCLLKNECFFSDLGQSSNVDIVSTRSDSAYGCSDTASMSFEHDYCDVVEEQFADNEIIEAKDDLFLGQFLLEHSYSVLSGSENPDSSLENLTKSHSVIVNGDVDNKLIFGLGDAYLKEKNVGIRSVVPNLLILQKPLKNYRIFLLNGCLGSKSAPSSSQAVTLPPNKFKNAGEALPFLMRRFKLWNQNAQNPQFKLLYPFIAASQEEFRNWPLGKRLNSEWNRAKEIRKILAEKFPTLKKWNTRACFVYARSHKYESSLKVLPSFYGKQPHELELIDDCFKRSVHLLHVERKSLGADEQVDVEADENAISKGERSTCIDISDPSLKNQCAFVKEAALDCGVVLKNEEITEGVIMNGAERMILEAVKCLAEGLIRRANHFLVTRKDYRDGVSEVTKNEVSIALKERCELESIESFQRKKRQIDYFS
ncbi:unnamed protein product [Phyllotreta striolata]|uniref:YEATS domain-containing protein n=1 Tax=Phyllotreta striolata TaxID=444603 RepID=A0A9N9XMH4_PHYSR|nr:unnamed protein product [Phyllotreta striolata]